MSDENNNRRGRARLSPARAAFHAAMRGYTPFSFEDVPDLDVLRAKNYKNILEMGMGQKASRRLVGIAQEQLAVINKAAMAGNEVASQTLWRIVKYWRDHPELEPAIEFVKAWEECGRPHTALQALASMQQWQRTFRVDEAAGNEPASWVRRLVAQILRKKCPPIMASDDYDYDTDDPRKESTSMLMCALKNPQYLGLQQMGEYHLSLMNDAALTGHEPASHGIWELVHYWREHPELEPGMDFERTWQLCGSPHTALRELALMQQQRRKV